jgi:antitoxin VapB
MSQRKHVRLFRDGRNQAVRIPVEFELPGDEAIMHRDGDRLVIEPVRKRGLIALLKSMTALDEDFPRIDDPCRLRSARGDALHDGYEYFHRQVPAVRR